MFLLFLGNASAFLRVFIKGSFLLRDSRIDIPLQFIFVYAVATAPNSEIGLGDAGAVDSDSKRPAAESSLDKQPIPRKTRRQSPNQERVVGRTDTSRIDHVPDSRTGMNQSRFDQTPTNQKQNTNYYAHMFKTGRKQANLQPTPSSKLLCQTIVAIQCRPHCSKAKSYRLRIMQ